MPSFGDHKGKSILNSFFLKASKVGGVLVHPCVVKPQAMLPFAEKTLKWVGFTTVLLQLDSIVTKDQIPLTSHFHDGDEETNIFSKPAF